MHFQKYLSARRLAAHLLLWNVPEIAARPNAQDAESSVAPTVAPVTSMVTVDGKPVTAIYTPTSFSITGLSPPITAATTVTTTDETGKAIAIAVAAGAGVVAGGALAAWLFEPAPGVPPAPTDPPSYTTSEQNEEPPTTKDTEEPKKTTTSTPPACPFPTKGAQVVFEKASNQPKWTVEISTQTTSSYGPKCTSSGDNGQLFRGTDPGFIKELSAVFCKSDQSKDESKELGRDDLPDDSSWKRDDGPEEKVKFTFDFKNKVDGCDSHCKSAYSSLISMCQFNSHSLYGEASLEQGCGTYKLQVAGEPITKLTCTGKGDNPLRNYMYRDAAKDAIKEFCGAQDGKVVKQNKDDSFIKETAFSVSYAKPCGGSGSYTIKEDLCIKYLTQTLDDCDTDTYVYKHGGSLQDEDNCGLFEFHPKGFDLISCYPDNENGGYISGGDHASVTKNMAKDAINAFCDRSGDGQQYTLDPKVKPETSNFIQDSCKEKGLASCGYNYRNDGTRTSGGDVGDIFIRFSATHFNPNDALECSTPQVYEIHGDRCKRMLAKFIGEGSVSKCVGTDENKLDLGTLIEAGDKGCVTWNAWAVKTH